MGITPCEINMVYQLTEEIMKLTMTDRQHAAQLAIALRQTHAAIDELMTEFVSNKRAANWQIINDAGVAAQRALAAWDRHHSTGCKLT